MLRGAIFSPQSVAILVISLVAFILNVGFLGGPSLLWLVFGLIAELAYVGATFSDPGAASAAVNRMFVERYNPAAIQNSRSRRRLNQAMEYYNNITQFAQGKSGAMQAQIEATLSEIDDWIEQIYKIAQRIDRYEENSLINRDRERVPEEIKSLERRVAAEKDEQVKAALRETIQLKRTQLAHLSTLESNIRRADIQLDNTLSALGTIYTQFQVVDSKHIDSGRTQRLRQEIHDEVSSLRDTIDAIDDVQQHTAAYTLPG
jgi:hypothetical protein